MATVDDMQMVDHHQQQQHHHAQHQKQLSLQTDHVNEAAVASGAAGAPAITTTPEDASYINHEFTLSLQRMARSSTTDADAPPQHLKLDRSQLQMISFASEDDASKKWHCGVEFHSQEQFLVFVEHLSAALNMSASYLLDQFVMEFMAHQQKQMIEVEESAADDDDREMQDAAQSQQDCEAQHSSLRFVYFIFDAGLPDGRRFLFKPAAIDKGASHVSQASPNYEVVTSGDNRFIRSFMKNLNQVPFHQRRTVIGPILKLFQASGVMGMQKNSSSSSSRREHGPINTTGPAQPPPKIANTITGPAQRDTLPTICAPPKDTATPMPTPTPTQLGTDTQGATSTASLQRKRSLQQTSDTSTTVSHSETITPPQKQRQDSSGADADDGRSHVTQSSSMVASKRRKIISVIAQSNANQKQPEKTNADTKPGSTKGRKLFSKSASKKKLSKHSAGRATGKSKNPRPSLTTIDEQSTASAEGTAATSSSSQSDRKLDVALTKGNDSCSKTGDSIGSNTTSSKTEASEQSTSAQTCHKSPPVASKPQVKAKAKTKAATKVDTPASLSTDADSKTSADSKSNRFLLASNPRDEVVRKFSARTLFHEPSTTAAVDAKSKAEPHRSSTILPQSPQAGNFLDFMEGFSSVCTSSSSFDSNSASDDSNTMEDTTQQVDAVVQQPATTTSTLESTPSEHPDAPSTTGTKTSTPEAESDAESEAASEGTASVDGTSAPDLDLAPSHRDMMMLSPIFKRGRKHQPKIDLFVDQPNMSLREKLTRCLEALTISYRAEHLDIGNDSSKVSQRLNTICRALENMFVRASVESLGALHVCGVPGSGKTMGIRWCCHQAKEWARQEIQKAKNEWLGESSSDEDESIMNPWDAVPSICHFSAASVQGIAYREAWDQLSDAMSHAMGERFQRKAIEITGKGSKCCIVLVLDEIDLLVGTPLEPMLKRLLEWSTDPLIAFGLIGISNSIENATAVRLHSLGKFQMKLAFETYDRQDLIQLVQRRIGVTIMDEKALQLLASTVSTTTADARQMLEFVRRSIDICRSSLDAATLDSTAPVTMPIINIKHALLARKALAQTSHKDQIQKLPDSLKSMLCVITVLHHEMKSRELPIRDVLRACNVAMDATRASMASDEELRAGIHQLVDAGLLQKRKLSWRLVTQEAGGEVNDFALDVLEDVGRVTEQVLLKSGLYNGIVDRVCAHLGLSG